MTRLLTCGYETGDVNEQGVSTIGANTTHTVVNTAPAPRAGSYCLKIACTSGTFSVSHKTFTLPAAKTEVWARWAMYMHPVSITGVEWACACLQDTAGSDQLTLSWDVSSTALRLYRGSGTGTLLGTSGTPLPPDTWHVLEWRIQILTATTGAAEVWLDGNRVINFSGDVANTATLNVQFLQLGARAGMASGTNAYIGLDDIAVNDTAGTINNGRPGDGRVVLLVPNGTGSSTQLTRGGTDTGANFSQVNELPPSIAQYVGSPTVGQRDLYAMADVAAAVQAINVVEAVMLAQNSDAGGGSIAPTLKSGATINEATAIGLSTSAGYVRSQWETDPNTGAAWTIAGVNALESGATVR